MGSSALPLIIFLMSFTHSEQDQNTDLNSLPDSGSSTDGSQGQNPEAGTSAETAYPVVKVSPDQHVFIGETVTFTCDTQTGEDIQWTYRGIKNSSPVPGTDRRVYEIPSVSDAHAGQYSCGVKKSSNSQTSVISAVVTLTVSERPKPVVKVSPAQPVFTGETVTLTCHIQTGGNIQWRYSWIKNFSPAPGTDERVYKIKSVSHADAGQYSCGVKKSPDSQRSVTSDVVKLTVSERPKPVVNVSPDRHVFTGERVTLTCDIQTRENIQWTRYSWIKDGDTYNQNYPKTRPSTVEWSFKADYVYYSGQYSCTGERSDSQTSDTSDAVTLTVSALPRSSVTVTPDSAVFTGETVNLKCVIEPDHSDWTYEWYKKSYVYNYGYRYSVLQLSHHHTVNRHILTVRGAAESDQGLYKCKGLKRSVSTQLSSEVSLTVNALPTPTVTMTPHKPVFTGETVNLKCEIKPYYSNLRYEWYKDNTDSVLLSSVGQTGDTLTIHKAAGSDEGRYFCKGLIRLVSSKLSSAASLLLNGLPRSTVNMTPANPVFIGETVSLKCEITPHYSNWRYEWYKNSTDRLLWSSHHYTVNGDTLTIRTAAELDQSQYWCKGLIRSVSTLISSEVFLSLNAVPRPTVTAIPDRFVFTGETVSLKCVITPYNSIWTYLWYKDHTYVSQSSDGHYTINGGTLTIRAALSDQGQYECWGHMNGRSVTTQLSAAVSLNVKDLKPKPELRSDSAEAVLTGNTVTLTCNTSSTGWDFYWYKNTLDSEINMTRTNSYSMKIDSVSDGGQYWCRAGRGEPVYYTQYSDQLTLNVTESPKAVVMVWPDEHVFRGETVTLRCDIKGGGNTEWTHRWQIDKQQTADKPINPCTRPDCCTSGTNQQHYRTAVSRCLTQELKISRVEVFHRGNYSCTGQMDTQSSQRSDAVALTVSSDEAQAAVRVSPQPWLTEGHSVTLICEVPGSSTGWTFSWFRDADHLSDSSRGAGGSYTLSPAALQHTGVYTCRAERGEPAYSSQNSSAQPLWVTGVSASVRLVLRPSRSQHFSSDSLSLSCDSGWRVRRYTHTNTQDCSAQTGSTCGIQSLSTSDTGVYWCESESGEKRHPLNITVHDGDVILESSADPVIEGETLTLHCLHRSTNSSIPTASFYKDGSPIQNQTGEMSIPTVSKSDEGFYYCETERGESPHSWISVRGSSSSLLIIGVSVGLTVFLLLLILLVLLLRHKKKKDPHCGVQPTLVSNPSGESQTDNLTLQSGSDNIYDDVSTVNNKDEEPVADVTYSEVTLKKNIPMNEDENIPGQSNTMYADVGTKAKKPKRKDINTAGPSDMTYAAISKKDKKKTTGKGAGISDVLIEMKSKEKHGGMSSKSGDTLYSELKLNTDGAGADAGGDATYAQVLSKKKKKTRL